MKTVKLFIYLICLICSTSATASAGETFRDPGPGLLNSARMPMGLPLDWQRVVALMPRQADILAACDARPDDCPSNRILGWLEALDSYRNLPPSVQLAKVNAWANDHPYRTDDANFGRPDYYASPLEFLERSGDCEDYVIFKYFALRALGFPEDSLQVVLVERLRDRVAHAVLAVRLDDGIFVLDNVTNRVARQSAVKQYRPLASFTKTKAWIHLAS